MTTGRINQVIRQRARLLEPSPNQKVLVYFTGYFLPCFLLYIELSLLLTNCDAIPEGILLGKGSSPYQIPLSLPPTCHLITYVASPLSFDEWFARSPASKVGRPSLPSSSVIRIGPTTIHRPKLCHAWYCWVSSRQNSQRDYCRPCLASQPELFFSRVARCLAATQQLPGGLAFFAWFLLIVPKMGSLPAIFFCQKSAFFFSQKFYQQLSEAEHSSVPPYSTQNGFSPSNFFMPEKCFFFLPKIYLQYFYESLCAGNRFTEDESQWIATTRQLNHVQHLVTSPHSLQIFPRVEAPINSWLLSLSSSKLCTPHICRKTYPIST